MQLSFVAKPIILFYCRRNRWWKFPFLSLGCAECVGCHCHRLWAILLVIYRLIPASINPRHLSANKYFIFLSVPPFPLSRSHSFDSNPIAIHVFHLQVFTVKSSEFQNNLKCLNSVILIKCWLKRVSLFNSLIH